MGIANRTSLLTAYFSPQRNFPISLTEVIRNGLLQKTGARIGPTYLLSVADRGSLQELKLRGIPDPLFWPKQLDRWELLKCCTECLYPPHWHHYEAPETTVEQGENVVDCGAAEGLFALSVARRAGKLALFEPWSGFRESLHATFGSRAVVLEQAVGSRSHTARLKGGVLYGVVSETEGDPIQVTTLDEFRPGFGPINFIKADVEGAEHDLLSGARETLLADKPKIAITCYHIGNDWEHMVRLVRSVVPAYQYRVKGLFWSGRKPRPVMLHLWV